MATTIYLPSNTSDFDNSYYYTTNNTYAVFQIKVVDNGNGTINCSLVAWKKAGGTTKSEASGNVQWYIDDVLQETVTWGSYGITIPAATASAAGSTVTFGTSSALSISGKSSAKIKAVFYMNNSIGTNTAEGTVSLTYKIKLTLNANGGSGGTQYVWYYYGINTFYSNEACTTTISTITPPTRTGYTFTQYNGDGTSGGTNGERYIYTGGGFATDLCTDITKDATLYAQWTANTVSIAYNPNGGYIDSASYGYNDYGWVAKDGVTYFHTISYSNSSDPYNATTFGLLKPGHNWNGNWYLYNSTDGITSTALNEDTSYPSTTYYCYGDKTKTTENTSNFNCYLYAGWTPRTYSITYDLDGGSVTTANPTSYTTEDNITLNNPTKTGYVFKGWTEKISTSYWNPGFINMDTGRIEESTTYPNSTFSEPIMLRSGVTYTLNDSVTNHRFISYSANYEYFETSSDATITPGTGDVLTRILYYDGTATEQNKADAYLLNSSTLSSVTIPTGSTGNRTYVANWKEITYTVAYDANGGSGNMSSVTHTYNTAKNLTANTFTRTGYTFDSWNTAADGTGTSYDDMTSVSNLTTEENGVVTLYAQWKPANVTYYKNSDFNGWCSTYGKIDGSWQPMFFYGKIDGIWQKIAYIEHEGIVLFKNGNAFYVSFGDSIAAGHAINDDWENNYGTGSQYGLNGNKETVIVPGSYTDLIRDDLVSKYDGDVKVTSFARSGDRVEDLIEKLDHDVIKRAVSKANYITVCIGANNILGFVEPYLDEYLNTGNLDNLAAQVEESLGVLRDDTSANSLMALINKFKSINPNAKYAFTTIYNPYKYVWIEKGTWDAEYNDSFFAPIFQYVPEMTTLGVEWDRELKKAILNTSVCNTLFDRANRVGAWAEIYITKLNDIIKSKTEGCGNSNFLVADTKAVFDPVPDRSISAPYHYNDLVNVEYTKGYDTAKMGWGQLWNGNVIINKNGNPVTCNDPVTFWDVLLGLYMDGVNVDYDGLAEALIKEVIEHVISKDWDPHPEEYGQYAMFCCFSEVFGWSSIPRRTITFNANGGTGSMDVQTVVALDGNTAYANINTNSFAHSVEGYYFAGWNTAADGSGTAYTNGQFIGLDADLTLYAQWSNIYSIRYRHSSNVDKVLYPDDSNTGHQECYSLTVAGELKRKLGTFAADDGDVYYYPYGTRVEMMVTDYHGANALESTFYDHHDGTIYKNNIAQASGRPVTWGFDLTCNVDIKFQWEIAGSIPTADAQSWWDCYITTN